MENIQFKIAEERTNKLIESINFKIKEIKDDELVFVIDEFKNKLIDLQKKDKIRNCFYWTV